MSAHSEICLPSDQYLVQSNHLVNSISNMTLNERRVLISALAEYNPFLEMPPVIYLKAQKFAQTWGLEVTGCYTLIRKAAEALLERRVEVYMPSIDAVRKYNWTSFIDDCRSGQVGIKFNKDLSEVLSRLVRSFSYYFLPDLKDLGKHALVLYMQLQEKRGQGYRDYDVDELYGFFPTSYKNWRDFNKYLFSPVIQELKAKLGATLSVKTKKEGRNVVGVRVYFAFPSDQLAFQFDVAEKAAWDVEQSEWYQKGYESSYEFEQAQKRSKAAGITFQDASSYRAWAVKNLRDQSIKHVEENYDLPLE